MESLFEAARTAQRSWRDRPIRSRLALIRRIRGVIASNADQLLDAFPHTLVRSRADSITAEVIPLAEACRFLELEAESILAPKKLSPRARPLWLNRTAIEVVREPFGVVLVIGPANYPLFLPAVQALHAIVAGNAVLVKPGAGGKPVLDSLASFARLAGLPEHLLTILDESVDSATAAIEFADKVVFTGSLPAGQSVLRRAAEVPVPVIAELSGHDPVFIQADADLERAAAALAFGANLNGGATCIAPRRIFVHTAVAKSFRGALKRRLGEVELTSLAAGTSFVEVRNDDEALRGAADDPHALGATVFGGERSARRLAARINAGVVVVNDMIVPTADPRLPFGGRKLSGFGTTRGAEGLLEMTTPKAIAVQRAKRLRHLEPVPNNAEELFTAFLAAKHSRGVMRRLLGWRKFIQAASQTRKVSNDKKQEGR